MARSLEFVAIGEQQALGLPNLRCVPWVFQKHARDLYQRRLEAMRSCTAEFMCFVDGGEDILLPDFAEVMQNFANQDLPIAYADELIHGKPHAAPDFTLQRFIVDHSIIHHGVVCRTQDLLEIKWPDGVYSWEVIAYGTLAQKGFLHDRIPRYDYRPSPTGARMWPTYTIGVISSKRFLKGYPEVNFGQRKR